LRYQVANSSPQPRMAFKKAATRCAADSLDSLRGDQYAPTNMRSFYAEVRLTVVRRHPGPIEAYPGDGMMYVSQKRSVDVHIAP
jgi:hypothetical protein